MVTRRTDYTADAVAAAKSVLLELTHLLVRYRDNIVLVGGWVPELLFSQSQEKHVGSMDIDLALNHLVLHDDHYRTIMKLLLEKGYRQGSEQPYIFYRIFSVSGREFVVQVDFLAGEYKGTGRSHRTQKFQEMKARKARGCDLSFEMYQEIKIEGELPGGGKDSADIRIASIVPFIVMKGMALHDRLKEKDAWDIYFCVKNYPTGPDGLVREFLPHITHNLVREGLKKIAEKFLSVEHVGPKSIADFEEETDPEERVRLQRDAYERVNYLLERLGIKGS